MTEFWVSQKQYWCKYCETFIRDDAPSRRQHENGLRHQGNKERFVRNLYKHGEKLKKDAEEERREMARIEQAAQVAFSSDVASGLAKHSSSSAGPSSAGPVHASSSKQTATLSSHIRPAAQKAVTTTPVRSFANYSTAESLGYTDPDVERAQAEAAKRQTTGFASDWQIVEAASASPLRHSSIDAEESAREDNGARTGYGKRRFADGDDEEDGRGWKLQKKTASLGLGEIYDPGAIAVKPRLKSVAKSDGSASPAPTNADTVPMDNSKVSTVLGDGAPHLTTTAAAEVGPQATPLPKWAPTKWKKAGEATILSSAPTSVPLPAEEAKSLSPSDPIQEQAPSPEPIPGSSISAKSEDLAVKLEEPFTPANDTTPVETAPSLFKKRRPPAGSGIRGRRG